MIPQRELFTENSLFISLLDRREHAPETTWKSKLDTGIWHKVLLTKLGSRPYLRTFLNGSSCFTVPPDS